VGVGAAVGLGTDGATPGVAACVTVTDASATRMVAFRSAPWFASAKNSIVPSPLPFVRLPCSHEPVAAACHPHPGVADTRIVTVPPDAGSWTDDVSTLKRQVAASCLTVILVPFTVSDAVRAVPMKFSATSIERSASPCPLPGLIWSHEESELADHMQSRAIAREAPKRPPDAATEPGVPVSEDSHRAVLGVDDSEIAVLPHAAAAQAATVTSS